jgi:hypothetical protein
MNTLMTAAQSRQGFQAADVLQQAGLTNKVVAGNFFIVTNPGPAQNTTAAGSSGSTGSSGSSGSGSGSGQGSGSFGGIAGSTTVGASPTTTGTTFLQNTNAAMVNKPSTVAMVLLFATALFWAL